MGVENDWTKRIAELEDENLTLKKQSRMRSKIFTSLWCDNLAKDDLIAAMMSESHQTNNIKKGEERDMGIENEWTKKIAELEDNVRYLTTEARKDCINIMALEIELHARDEMIAAMTDDLVSEKKQVLRWSQSIHKLLIERDRLLDDLRRRSIQKVNN